MPLPPTLARWLPSRGHDAVHASDVGLDRAPDSDIILHTRQQTRTIVTADLDYPRLLAIARAVEPSLILFRGGDWSQSDVIGRMEDILTGLNETDIAQSILVIERNRVRRRRLPIDG